MPARSVGTRKLSSVDTDRLDIDVSKAIGEYETDDAPFLCILNNIAKVATNSMKIFWYDQAPETVWTKINNGSGYNTSATDLVVDDSTIFSAKDLLLLPRTGEQMLITAINHGTNTLTVTRGHGDVTAAAINDNDDVVKLANAMEEDSTVPTGNYVEPVEFSNNVQEIRLPFSGSWWQEDAKTKTAGTPRDIMSRQKLKEFRRNLERLVIGGRPKVSATNPTMGGVMSFMDSTRVFDVATGNEGILTESYLNSTLAPDLFQYGPREKLLVASPKVVSAFSEFGNAKLVLSKAKDNELGVNVHKYYTPHGIMNIIPSWTLVQGWNGYAMLLDLDSIKLRPFAGHDATLSRNIQAADKHGYTDEYWGMYTLEVRNSLHHAVIKGVSA